MSPTATRLPSGLSATVFTTGWMPGTSRIFSAVTGDGGEPSAQPATTSAAAAASARIVEVRQRMLELL